MRSSESGNGSGSHKQGLGTAQSDERPLHPAWSSFLRYCEELQFGEIERLKIQEGLPVMAELTTKKVKFAP
jgi:hypothetical protein